MIVSPATSSARSAVLTTSIEASWSVGVMLVLGGAVFAWDGIVIGATDFTYAMAATVAPAVVTLVWLGGVLVLDGELEAVWWGIVLLMVLRSAMLAWWHRVLLPTAAGFRPAE